MKLKFIVTMTSLLITFAVEGADGTITYNNRIAGVLEAPVYGPEPGNPALELDGNEPSGFPAGVTIYSGTRLRGEDYSAELWFQPLGEPDFSPVPDALTTFRTSLAGAGFIIPLVDPEIPGVAAGEQVTLQLRAWDNQGGLVNDWATAELMNAQRGMSLSFLSEPLGGITVGGDPVSSPNLLGLRSFNIVPEPRSVGLLALGAAVWVLTKRRLRG